MPFVRRLFKLAVLALVCTCAQATTVRMHTVLGPVDVDLYDAGAPLTVANFLGYVDSGAYANSFIHRSEPGLVVPGGAPGFIIQGGGYTWKSATSPITKVPAGPAVVNEFDASRSNLRGTIAMAKIDKLPDSATTEWFINLADNSANLDAQNGGFTVFGKVRAPGMAVVDAIAALRVVSITGSSVFTKLPVISVPASGSLLPENLVMVSAVSRFAAAPTDSDRLFSYLEAAYPQYLSPAKAANAVSDTASGYYYRYYPGTNAYIGTANGRVYYLVPAISADIQLLGTLADWVAVAAAAGY